MSERLEPGDISMGATGMVEAQKFSIIIGLDKMLQGLSNPFFFGGGPGN